MATRGGIPVEGTCRFGHVTRKTSPKGRITWRGECSHDTCTAGVICRAAGRPAAGAATDPTKPTTVTLPSGRTIRKVGAYRDEQRPAAIGRDHPVAGDGPPGVPTDDVDPDAGDPAPHLDDVADDQADDDPVGDVDEGGPRRRRRRSWRVVSRADLDAAGDIIPGIY